MTDSMDTFHGYTRRYTSEGLLDTLTAPAAFEVRVAIDTSVQPAKYQKCTLLLSKGTTILRQNSKDHHVWYHSALRYTKTLEDGVDFANTAEGEKVWPDDERGWYGTKGFVIDDSAADGKALWLQNFTPKGPGATSYDLGPRLDVTQQHTDAAEVTDRSGVMTTEQGTSTGIAFDPFAVLA